MRAKRNRMPTGALKKSNVARKPSVADLLRIMARLRGPSGCPWDKEQTGETLKKFLIEEAYETLEAIETGTPEELKEELGDLLLQIVFLSRIAEEKGEFGFSDVVHTLAEKLIRRHPHVFPPAGRRMVMADNARDVVKVWRATKELEGKYAERRSLVDDIPLALPALERARRISQRVSRVGLDWPTIDAAWENIEEKLARLKKAARRSSREAVEEKLGDVIFTLVNWARLKDISAEEALRKSNRHFSKRIRQVEVELRRRGKALEEATPEHMDRIWNIAEIAKKGKH
jgi:tetrapyrrole methylase family protein / MazG family protein